MVRASITCTLLLAACASTSAPRPKPAVPAVREGMWAIRGTRLFVRDVGPRDAPVLLVLHGGPGGNHRSLRPLEALAPAYRVVLYDQRGSGASDRLPVSLAAPQSLARLSLEQNIEDIEALRRRLGREKISLIGHSFGAALAVLYAAAHPERVERLVVYSGGPETLDLARRKKAAHNARLTAREKRELGQGMARLGAALKRGAPQDALDRVFTALAGVMFPSLYCKRPASASAESGRGGFWANQVVGKYVESFDYDTIAAGLRRVRAPTLLTWGRCEPSPLDRLANLLDFLPDARLVIFEKSGHNAMEEQEALFFRVLRAFLAGDPLPIKSYGPRAELPGAPFASARRRLVRWGDRLTRWLLDGRTDDLFALFSPQMKQALPLERLRTFQGGLALQLGHEQEVLDETHSVLPSMTIYRRLVRFAKLPTPMEVSWTLTGLDQARPTITGFHVREPARPAETERLAYRTRTALRLPFRGRWLVAWGGRTVARNYHARARDQRFAYDFLVAEGGATHRGDGKRNAQYHCFGRPILAAGAGTVVAAQDGLDDRTPGVVLETDPLGNHVIIDHGNGERSFYCHLKRGSVAVKPGQRVEAGARLGACGNSGRSSEPHLHFHLQDSPTPLSGAGIPAQFQRYRSAGALVERGEPVQGEVVEPLE